MFATAESLQNSSALGMPAKIFQNFKKVWTTRVPDSGYDSLGPTPPIAPIVMTPLASEAMGTGISLESAIYYAGVAITSATETIGTGITLESATYTAPTIP